MGTNVRSIRDLLLLNVVGVRLFELIVKARARSGVATLLRNPWLERDDGFAVGYESSWPGISPQMEK